MRIVGHRGAAGEAPENTIAGIQHALSVGIFRVEIDLRLAADGQLVVVHDSSLARTHGVNLTVTSLSAEALKAVPVSNERSINSPPYTHVPSLNELLSHASHIEHFQLELKSDETTQPDKLIAAIDTFFSNNDDINRFVFTSFDTDLLCRLHDKRADLPLGLIAKDDSVKMLNNLDILPFQYLCLFYPLVYQLTPAERQIINEHGVHLSAWTVNEQHDLDKLSALGVDSIITDFPSKFAG